MKRLQIDFRANFSNCDYDTKMFFRCDTAADLRTAKNAILAYIDKEIAAAEQQGEMKGGEG